MSRESLAVDVAAANHDLTVALTAIEREWVAALRANASTLARALELAREELRMAQINVKRAYVFVERGRP